jgi:hypothetical protein
MLTQEEINCIYAAEYWGADKYGVITGDSKLLLTPHGMLAMARGVEFARHPTNSKEILLPLPYVALMISCTEDVSQHLGYECIEDYLMALHEFGQAIMLKEPKGVEYGK